MTNLIRKAKEYDSEIITRIHLNSWKTTYNNFFSKELFIKRELEFEERNKKIKEKIINDDNCHYIIYEENKNILGFLCYGVARGNKYDGMGEIYCIYLEERNQRRGIGTKLIEEAFKLLRQEGYKKIIIRCLDGNPSFKFYEILGGKKTDSEIHNIGGKNVIENIYKFDI